MSILVLLMMSVLSTTTAFADCTYVSIEKGKATKTVIPSDFPVLINTGNPAADQESFNNALAEWRLQHPDLASLDMTPSQSSGRFIQIPKNELDSFSPEKRDAIQATGGFYQIIQ
jgi:hypothetical protein